MKVAPTVNEFPPLMEYHRGAPGEPGDRANGVSAKVKDGVGDAVSTLNKVLFTADWEIAIIQAAAK
jgi:hypothetical protein